MFVVTPFPNVLYALDPTRPGAPAKLYAANGLSNTISVIDTSSNRVVGTVKSGDGSWGIAVN